MENVGEIIWCKESFNVNKHISRRFFFTFKKQNKNKLVGLIAMSGRETPEPEISICSIFLKKYDLLEISIYIYLYIYLYF